MPCNSDYMAASGQELESKRVCELLVYVYECTGVKVPAWISKASADYYGNTQRIDEATALLCGACRGLTQGEQNKYLFNGRKEMARKLASWYERHQEWDARRVKEEDESRRKIMLKDRAVQKLSVEEREALGL